MRAIVSTKYGSPDTLELKIIEKPQPSDDEVLVKIHASSVNHGNLVLLKGEPWLARLAYGLFKPKYPIPGGDMAGTVEAVGKNVTQFQPGDEVFGDLSSCGWGAFAEYVSVPENAIATKPANVSYEEAAAVPMAAVTALQALRDKGKMKSGQKILIYGASGGVGTFAVQIAKAFDAEVTAVVSTRNVKRVKELGADHVIDYKKEDIETLKEPFDLIMGVNGTRSISTYKKLLKNPGIFVNVGGGSVKQLLQTMIMGPISGDKKVSSFMQKPSQHDLIVIKELIEAEKVKPIIERKYSLIDVPEALNYFAEGHSQGKIVITI
ncbi:NAD(P)-dependent alcohol dehydrogenase [Niallia sp. Krafla_26]|uniref:NAD(P)-dependent alcohol dehydrogenase n=1 Tax=Niallia sp. Krafla_26 TaxID=3064703 RepID=UPI003D17172D